MVAVLFLLLLKDSISCILVYCQFPVLLPENISLLFTVIVCLPLDGIIVQVQQWGVVGAQRVVEQVILNGVSLPSTSQQVDSIIQTMSADALLPTVISVNQTSGLSKKIIIYQQRM